MVHVTDKIYDLKGNQIIAGTYKDIKYESQFGGAWCLRNDKEYTVITSDGTVLYKAIEDDNTYIDNYNFAARKTIDDESYYYSFKDRDYTIKNASAVMPWIIKKYNEDSALYSLVNSVSGKEIIKGYENIACVCSKGADVYVYGATEAGNVDIYILK